MGLHFIHFAIPEEWEDLSVQHRAPPVAIRAYYWCDCNVEVGGIPRYQKYPRFYRAALCWTGLAVTLCLCLSVSVTSQNGIQTAERIEVILGWERTFADRTLRYNQYKEIWVSPKIRYFLPELCETPDCRNFARLSRPRCQQNSLTVELVDHTYDGRRIMAGRALFITRRSTIKILLHNFDLLSTCRTTCSYCCATVDKISTDIARSTVHLHKNNSN